MLASIFLKITFKTNFQLDINQFGKSLSDSNELKGCVQMITNLTSYVEVRFAKIERERVWQWLKNKVVVKQKVQLPILKDAWLELIDFQLIFIGFIEFASNLVRFDKNSSSSFDGIAVAKYLTLEEVHVCQSIVYWEYLK